MKLNIPIIQSSVLTGAFLIASTGHAFFNRLPIFNQCFYASHMPSTLPNKKVVLTFDDGPNKNTEALLEVLEKHQVKAAFFMLGRSAENRIRTVKSIWERGHIIANHSYSHESFHNLYQRGVTEEIMKTDNILSPFMKEKFFRYPYGNSTCAAEEVLTKNDYIKVGWQIDTCDYAFSDKKITQAEASQCGLQANTEISLLEHTLKLIEKKKGGIVLFHDIHANTVETIDTLIPELISRGYQFVNLDDSDVLTLLKAESEKARAQNQTQSQSRDIRFRD